MDNDETPKSEIILYQTEDGRTRIQCRFENETIWLTQALIAELFQVTPQNVTLHLKSIYEDGELDELATCKDYLQVRSEVGREVSRKLRHYNLAATGKTAPELIAGRADATQPNMGLTTWKGNVVSKGNAKYFPTQTLYRENQQMKKPDRNTNDSANASAQQSKSKRNKTSCVTRRHGKEVTEEFGQMINDN